MKLNWKFWQRGPSKHDLALRGQATSGHLDSRERSAAFAAAKKSPARR